jgi:hypothetical protein
MGLDLLKLLPQVQKLGQTAAKRAARLAGTLPNALAALDQTALIEHDTIQDHITRAKQHARLALPSDEPINATFPQPPHPPKLHIIGADGSQIYPDRHAPTMYSLINIGSIVITHSSSDPPVINNEPRIIYAEEPGDADAYVPISSAIVDGQRDAAEMTELANQAEGCIGTPTLALLDNGLLLWLAMQMQDRKSSALDLILKQYISALRQIKRSGAALAGFIDRPRNANVLNLLHAAHLPLGAINEETLRANPYRGLTDRSLFAQKLPSGHRSARFIDPSPANDDFRSAGHEVQFFYLNVGVQDLIARVEIPAWVAERAELMDWVHAGLLEQCRTTGGFPYALIRAHELAVVTQQDRQALEGLLSQELLTLGLDVRPSQKSLTKRWTSRRRRHRL